MYDKIPSNPVYKFGSVLLEDIYRIFSPIKPCSVILEEKSFDGVEHSLSSFYDYSTQFFDKPELFFKQNIPENFDSIKRVQGNHHQNFSSYSFPSPYQTEWQSNNTAYFDYFSGKNNADTILLFAPGWARENLNAEKTICNNLLKHGIDSCLLVKPFHQQRTPDGFFSGELFISGNIFLTVMNFRQFVAEIVFLINYFKPQYKKIGLIGMSSGGFQCGLAADVQEVDFYFPIITGSSLGSITWNGKMSRFVKKSIIKKGITETELTRAWAISDQYYLGQNCKAKHIKQFISLYDEVVPTKYQFQLWEIYKKPDLTLMHCAHTGIYFYFNRIVSEISAFINNHK